MPPLGWEEFSVDDDFLDSPAGYRCIDGKWTFSRPKFTPMFDQAGYCPDDSQCFIGSGISDNKVTSAEKACVDSGTFNFTRGEFGLVESFYCYEGNWTTRTKEIALQMLNMTSKDDAYTIFCDRFDRSLNSDEFMNYYRDYFGEDAVLALASGNVNEFCVMDLNGQVIAGVSLNVEINEPVDSGDCAPGGVRCLEDGVCKEPDNYCLKDEFVTGEVPSAKSFLQMLKGDNNNNYCDVAIFDEDGNPVDDGEYHQCDGPDVYYNAKLNNVIFTKPHDLPFDMRQSVPMELVERKTFIDVIFDFVTGVIKNLMGIAGLAKPQIDVAHQDQIDFVKKAGSFDKLYISYSPPSELFGKPRYIKAIRETRYSRNGAANGRFVTFISAEYHNYKADICRFFYNHNYDEIRRQISEGGDNIQCTPVILGPDEWMYSVYVENPVFENIDDQDLDIRIWRGAADSFWNDITAKIRTQKPRETQRLSVAVPDFTFSPENPVVGTPVEFSVVPSDELDNSRLIAMTWDFGDGGRASSYFDVSPNHVYTASGDYDVVLWVMDDNYNIDRRSGSISVDVGPSVVIRRTDNVLDKDGVVEVEFVISGGHEPYNVYVEWGDETSDQGSSDEAADEIMDPDDVISPFTGNKFTATHDYMPEDNVLKPVVSVRVVDRDGVEFGTQQRLLVYQAPQV